VDTKDEESMIENEATLRKAIELNPHSAIAYYNLGLLLSQDPSRVSDAETAYRKAFELESNNPKYIYRLGLLLHENLHRFEEAETAYRLAIELAPDEAFYYGGLISLLVLESKRSEALALSIKMRAMLNINKNWYGLATLDAILGNVEPAIGYLRQAAVEASFNREWARNDPDLSSIRNDPRFDEIVDSP
jgi:tetratricopeptide (TPR) repeat protein